MIELLQYLLLFVGIVVTSIFLYEMGRIFYAGIVAVRTGRKTQRATRPSPSARLRILIAGDSTAVGVGCSKPGNSIAGRLIEDFPDAHIENIAVNGISTRLLRDKLELLTQDLTLRGYYDTVIIHTGGMDVLFLVSSKRYAQLLTACLDRARMLGKHVILVSPPNVGSSPLMRFLPLKLWYTWRSRYMRAATLSVVQALKVTHVDLFAEGDKNPLNTSQGLLYAGDFSHPNDEGYGIWYKPIKEAVVSLTTPGKALASLSYHA